MTIRRRPAPKRRPPAGRGNPRAARSATITVEMTREELHAINYLTSYVEQDLQRIADDEGGVRDAARLARVFTRNQAGR